MMRYPEEYEKREQPTPQEMRAIKIFEDLGYKAVWSADPTVEPFLVFADIRPDGPTFGLISEDEGGDRDYFYITLTLRIYCRPGMLTISAFPLNDLKKFIRSIPLDDGLECLKIAREKYGWLRTIWER